ncbi:hypothetical protein [Brevundimonas sp.]|uniref:hypothetical protein n=1 Tax=Brevundimonas sp. TaxID=1871086 RepID=UPI003F6F7EFC
MLAMTPAWLQRHRWLGTGPSYIKHGRAVRYELAALEDWIANHRRRGTEVAR